MSRKRNKNHHPSGLWRFPTSNSPKAAVLNTPTSKSAQRSYDRANELKPLSNRAFTGPESASHALVNHGHERRVDSVMAGERTAFPKRYAQRAEILFAHHPVVGDQFLRMRGGPSLPYEPTQTAFVCKWRACCERRGLNTGNGLHPLQQSLIERHPVDLRGVLLSRHPSRGMSPTRRAGPRLDQFAPRAAREYIPQSLP